MKFTASKINWFLLFKLPSAFFSGVRVRKVSDEGSLIQVRFRWINQNPFKSMYWATQGMASELATGILVMKYIAECQRPIAMLVTRQEGSFSKKARGRIRFSCTETKLIKETIQKAISSGGPQTMHLSSKGIDEQGDEVSNFTYEWSIKLR